MSLKEAAMNRDIFLLEQKLLKAMEGRASREMEGGRPSLVGLCECMDAWDRLQAARTREALAADKEKL
jgi:hypothetical protein